MIKKTLLFFISIFVLISCEKNNSNRSLTIKLNEDLHQELLNQYSFNDINVKVYDNKNDWANESNELFSGKLNNNGVIEINDIRLTGQNYYLDIFTDDMKWNNWGDNKFEESFSSTIFIILGIKPFVGEWNLSSINQQGNENLVRIPLNISIQKDFKVNFTDSVNGEIVTVKYDITNIIDNGYFDMEINENQTNNSEYIYPSEWFIYYVNEFDFIIMPNRSISDNTAIEYTYTKE